MRELGQCYVTSSKSQKAMHLYGVNHCRNEPGFFFFSTKGGREINRTYQAEFFCKFIDKSYFSLVSVICNLQGSKMPQRQ